MSFWYEPLNESSKTFQWNLVLLEKRSLVDHVRVDVMICFLLVWVNSLWRRCTKWCGEIPFLIMVKSSDNGLSMTWKKLQTLLMKMCLMNLPQYSVSKDVLLLIAICQLLARLSHKWTSFLNSLLIYTDVPEVVVSIYGEYRGLVTS